MDDYEMNVPTEPVDYERNNDDCAGNGVEPGGIMQSTCKESMPNSA